MNTEGLLHCPTSEKGVDWGERRQRFAVLKFFSLDRLEMGGAKKAKGKERTIFEWKIIRGEKGGKRTTNIRVKKGTENIQVLKKGILSMS